MKIITATGPESTGKSSLINHLSIHFQCQKIEEYSRIYLEKNGPDYGYDHLIDFATVQSEMIQSFKPNDQEPFLFVDTDALTIKIWSEEKFGKYEAKLDLLIQNTQPYLYLLCYPDLKWEEDPLRENKEDLHKLFNIYESELIKSKQDYIIVSGLDDYRYLKVIDHINNILKE